MMKISTVMAACLLMLTTTGCGRGGEEAEEEKVTVDEEAAMDEKVTVDGEAAMDEKITVDEEDPSVKELVVYFSWSGHTKNVADAIAEQTGADMFEIIPEEAYTEDYDALLDIAAEEKESGARPAIAGSVENIEQYDTIYIGYPNWWSGMPMILYTFFDSYDLSGRRIAPFCTSGGSGLSDTVNSIRELEPEAEILEGLHIGSLAASDPEQAVSEWLDRLGA